MNYTQLISSNPVVLVEFYATWCPHCKKMMPIVDQVKEQLNGAAEICQLDIDQNDEVADEVEVTSVPTFLLYKDGKEVWRQSGEMTAQALLSKIQSAL